MDSFFSLGTYNKVPLTVLASDTAGNVVTGVTPVVTSSDTTVLALETAIDGTVTAVRVAASAGSAVVTAVVTNSDGSVATGTLTVSLDSQGGVGSSNVTSVEIVAGVPA
jgi:hypothetical protein